MDVPDQYKATSKSKFPELHHVFQKWVRRHGEGHPPLDAKGIRKDVHPRFAEFRQQDSHEFLMDLITAGDMVDIFRFDVEMQFRCTNPMCNESWNHTS